MAFKYMFVITLIIGVAVAQQDDLSSALDSLPPEFQGKVDEAQAKELQNKTTALFKEKCEKNGGPEAFGRVESAGKDVMTCVNALVDQTVLKKEIEEAKPVGKVDEVFKKYCAKSPDFKKCFYDGTEAIKPCFTSDEQKNLNIVYNITEQLAEFVCFKNGDRIALFIAEGGPDCIQDNTEAIQTCVNQTLGADVKLDTANITLDSLPTLTFGEKECGKMTLLEKCVVGVLEQCQEPTTANIVESLFKFARKATPCKNFAVIEEASASKRSGARTLAVTTSMLVAAVAISLY